MSEIDTKTEIIVIAQKYFFAKGYGSTSLQDIANDLNIKPASLYYHFSGGKEEIYLTVLEERLKVYKDTIDELRKKSQNLEQFLLLFGEWFILQPTMNMDFIVKLDMPHLTNQAKAKLMSLISKSIFQPLYNVFLQAKDEIKNIEPMKLVGLYINLLNGVVLAVGEGFTSKDKLIQEYVEILMRGISKPR